MVCLYLYSLKAVLIRASIYIFLDIRKIFNVLFVGNFKCTVISAVQYRVTEKPGEYPAKSHKYLSLNYMLLLPRTRIQKQPKVNDIICLVHAEVLRKS